MNTTHMHDAVFDLRTSCCGEDIRNLPAADLLVTRASAVTCRAAFTMPPLPATGSLPEPVSRREALGRLVRRVWVAWAREQDEPSWLVSWEGLGVGQREVCQRIGEAVYAASVLAASIDETSGGPDNPGYRAALEALDRAGARVRIANHAGGTEGNES